MLHLIGEAGEIHSGRPFIGSSGFAAGPVASRRKQDV